MQEPWRDAHENVRTLRVLELAAVSGFMENVWNLQESCLSLCNTCRENVPVQHLWISHGVPPSIMADVYPCLRQAEAEGSSRALRHRRVLGVHWGFVETSRKRRISDMGEKQHEEAEREGRGVGAHEADRAVDGIADINKVKWPRGTRDISLGSLNRPIGNVTWPESLKQLVFGQRLLPPALIRTPDIFNTALDGVTFPAGLREIFLGDKFNQPIEGVAWPRELERLSLPGFNQSICDVQWPRGLKALEFVAPSSIQRWKYTGKDEHRACANGEDFDERIITRDLPREHGRFNQPLGTTLPQSLETLYLSEAFDQPLASVSWPSGIVTLGLAVDFRRYRYSGSVTWPSNLRDLCMVNKPLEVMTYPQGSNVTRLTTIRWGGGLSAPRTIGIEYYNRDEDPNSRRNTSGEHDSDTDSLAIVFPAHAMPHQDTSDEDDSDTDGLEVDLHAHAMPNQLFSDEDDSDTGGFDEIPHAHALLDP